MSDNLLFYGDNLQVLQHHIEENSVDLIYLDPPFNSNQDYNVLFQEHDGTRAAAQIQAFTDTWEWNEDAATAYAMLVETGPTRLAQMMQSFHGFLGNSNMMAYLAMMAPRLVELRRVLKSTGSLYLHCDATASHYLKLLLDAVFGPENFRNEIIWRRSGSHNSAKRYGPIHDVILFYTVSDNYTWNKVYRPYSKEYVRGFFNKSDERGRYRSQTLTGSGTRGGESGKEWRGYDVSSKGRHWAFPGVLAEALDLEDGMSQHEKLDYLHEEGYLSSEQDGLPEYRQYLHMSKGVPLQDIWAYQPFTNGVLHGTDEAIDEDVRWLGKRGTAERLGYPTQKPEGLLERIIRASSNPGDLVLDPFCGCGTTIAAAQRLERRWIGVDITHLAIGLIKSRLRETYGEDVSLKVQGEPTTEHDARELARTDPWEFQAWALGLVDARRHDSKRGADKGIDGRMFLRDGRGGHYQLIFSVKSGKLKADDIRSLGHVVQREDAEMGVLITLETPSRGMKADAVGAGFYESPWGRYPKLQIVTVGELLEGKRIERPYLTHANATFKTAPRASRKDSEVLDLLEQSSG